MILDNQERILFFIFQRMGCASSKADVVECREEHSTPLEELNIDKQSTSVKEEPVESIQQKQNVASALPDMADKGSAPPTNEIPTCRSDSLISPIQCPAEMDSIPRISSLSDREKKYRNSTYGSPMKTGAKSPRKERTDTRFRKLNNILVKGSGHLESFSVFFRRHMIPRSEFSEKI